MNLETIKSEIKRTQEAYKRACEIGDHDQAESITRALSQLHRRAYLEIVQQAEEEYLVKAA